MDEESYGFDAEAGKYFIYPTNYPKREYQFNIIKEALFKNTLVSLPTGLGKTFIAAVVMYNYYRWFPSGKIIFMAPTKPLVKQQIEACYNIMAIPKEVTAEITGVQSSEKRKNIWKSKKVFFITPQVLQNDLDTEKNLAKEIRCLVIDEAHKAQGNYSYCEVVKKLLEKNKHFRVLALSATPGSSFEAVVEIIRALLIYHIEVRTKISEDIVPYLFDTKTETIVVPLGDAILHVKEIYEKLLEPQARILAENNIVQGNFRNLTKGRIILEKNKVQQNNKRKKVKNFSEITSCLNTCVTLYHAYDLLIRYGITNFCSFLKEHLQDKPYLRSKRLAQILNDAEKYIGPPTNTKMLPDGSVPEVSERVVFGHPKYYKLAEVVKGHFDNCGEKTKVIIFCEYRECVYEAYTILLKHRPIIKPKVFVGQRTMKQNEQIATMKKFRSGECNTLLATCIAEEGLDIGEVDLIVCFDMHSRSPIRMVQRMGRTGRKSDGRIVFLVTEGREQQLLQDALKDSNRTVEKVLKSAHLTAHLYQGNPRMIPSNIEPMCREMHMTVDLPSKKPTAVGKDQNKKGSKKGKGKTVRDIREMFSGMSNTQKAKNTTNNAAGANKKCDSSEVKIFNSDKDTNFLAGLNVSYYNELITEISHFVKLSKLEKKSGTFCEQISKFHDRLPSAAKTKPTLFDFTVPSADCLNNISANMFEQFMTINYFVADTNNEDYFNGDDMFEDEIFEYPHIAENEESPLKNGSQQNQNQRLLSFFKLETVEDVFSEDFARNATNEVSPSQDVSNSREGCESPILRSFNKSQVAKYKSHRSQTAPEAKQSSATAKLQILLGFFKLATVEEFFVNETYVENNEHSDSENVTNQTKTDFDDSPEKQKTNDDDKDFLSIREMVDCIQDSAEVTLINKSTIKSANKRNRSLNDQNDYRTNIKKTNNGIAQKQHSHYQRTLARSSKSPANKSALIASINLCSQEIINKTLNATPNAHTSQQSRTKPETSLNGYVSPNSSVIFLKSSSEDERVSQEEYIDIEEQRAIEQSIRLSLQEARSRCAVKKNKLSLKKAAVVVAAPKKPVTERRGKVSQFEELQKYQESLTQDEIDKILGTALITSDSDTDFQISPLKSAVKRSKTTNETRKRIKTKQPKQNGEANNDAKQFVHFEAEISSDENVSADEECSESLDSSFIDDADKTIITDNEIHAHYLQTTKSPLQNKGVFKIPQGTTKRMDVFSQIDNTVEDNTYVYDSFCVNTEDVTLEKCELSELEIAENRLEMERKRKKKCFTKSKKGHKRKRIQIKSSSESD